MTTSRPAREPAGRNVLAGPGTVIVITGLTFAISDELGDIGRGPLGLIVRDTRHLSRLELRIEGELVRHLGAATVSPDIARFRGYVMPEDHYLDAPLEVDRQRRVVPDGLDEDITLHWWDAEPRTVEVSLEVGCDFADIFEVRRLGATAHEAPTDVVARHAADHLTFSPPNGERETTVRFSRPADEVTDGIHRWSVALARGMPWTVGISVRAVGALGAGGVISIGHPPPPRRAPARVRTDPDDLARACRRSLADFDALSLPDNLDSSRRLVAAGIPWFVALFGRDSLIASYQARAFAPHRMLDTLRALAARQGSTVDPANGEEPGKILHEVRLTDRPWLGHGTTGGHRPYFGSIDATPLFLMLYGAAWRWGAPREELRALLPAAEAALGWMRHHGDPDGDGLIEYRSDFEGQLVNQAWKDSENAVQHPDGRSAIGPIAMVEVQAYAYRARRELVALLAWFGKDEAAADLAAEADGLRRLIRERYWCSGTGGGDGFFALALDGDKVPVASVASNMGHLLWCGVPSNEEAVQVAAHLTGPAISSGWGIRTLSSDMSGYNPISYHVGSVWPHDTAIACDGLRRYGFDSEALEVAAALIEALGLMDDRLPELFGGHSRRGIDFPVPYPAACRPQAWSAGVPLAFVPLFLGLEPSVHEGTISLDPALPTTLDRIEVRGIPFPSGELSVSVDRDGLRVIDAPPGLAVEFRPRRSLADRDVDELAS